MYNIEIWKFLVFGLLTFLLLSNIASAAHTFDAKVQYQTTSWSNNNPGTLPFTAGSGASVMVLTIFTERGYRTEGTPTFNDQEFKSLGRNMYTNSPEGSSEMWYLLLTPTDTGFEHTVIVPNAATSRLISFHVSTFKSATGVSVLDVNASKSASGSSPSQSVTTTADGDVIVAGMFSDLNTAPTVTSPGTEIYSSAPMSYKGMSQYYLQSSNGIQPLGWTGTSDSYSMQTAAFKEVILDASNTDWIAPSQNTGGSGVTNPSNAYASDTSYAIFNGGGSSNMNYYKYNFSSIPGDAKITGIEVNALGNRSGPNGTSNRYMRVQLSWNNGTTNTWTSYSTDITQWSTSFENHLLGGYSDTWGHYWTRNEIVNGLRIQAQWLSTSSSVDANLDYIPVRVYYTSASNRHNLSGYITNETDGTPLNFAIVQINSTIPPTTTNAQGYYIFTGLANNMYLIDASLSGYATNSATRTIDGNNVNNVNISLSPLPAYLVSGYISNASSGAAISGVKVTVDTTPEIQMTTGGTGIYSFMLSNGDYLITANKTGYYENSIPITLDGEALSNANISMSNIPLSLGKIHIATNRYVILDDWSRTGSPGTGFSLPSATHGSNSWTGINTKINATALFIDNTGSPLPGKLITFNLYQPNNVEYTAAKVTATTNTKGLASFSFDMDKRNYYGNWTVKASYDNNISDNTSFIYNWWGCGQGGCEDGHSDENPSGSKPKNSPYLSGRETPESDEHSGIACTKCHQSFDGTAISRLDHTSDIHRNLSCTDSNCHQSSKQHFSSGAVIGSCYSATCHKPAKRDDISSKSTLSSPDIATAMSLYSWSNGTLFNNTFHTPNSTVPCFTCHGPMHNITKPDAMQRFIWNNNTESSQCITCHASYALHNNGVNCTVCHSEDVHAIKVFAQDATYVTLNKNNPNTYRGNCTNCHQDPTFLTRLLTQAKAGSYSGSAPQVQKPLNHSTDKAGAKWGTYWTNTKDACIYCHGDNKHTATRLGNAATAVGSDMIGGPIGSGTVCSSCHNSADNDYAAMMALLIPDPVSIINGQDNWNASGTNHASYSTTDIICKSCHGGVLSGSADISEFVHNVDVGGGGPDCLGCHDSTGSANHLVDGNAISTGIHANLNSGASANNVSAANKKCWGCHDSKGTQPEKSMGDIFNTPYKCNDCHLSTGQKPGAYGATLVDEHRPTGADIKVAAGKTDLEACIQCHNKSEMKVNFVSPDNIDTNYSLVSHYGRNRSDLHSVSNETNCAYCHKANSTFDNVFQKINNNNITHDNGQSCLICHRETGSTSGRIHDAPLLGGGGPDCRSCHDVGKTNVLRHIDFNAAGQGMHGNMNININATNGPCWGCHQTGGTQPPGMGDRAYTPYICTDCHLTGGSASGLFNAPIVSEHYRNGTDITAVTAKATDVLSCTACHQRPEMIIANNDTDNGTYDSDNNGVFGGPTNPYVYGKNRVDIHSNNETNCSYCHQATSVFNDTFRKLSNTQITHNNGKSCYLCHRESGSVNGRIHDSSLIGGSGGEDCISCHVPEDVNASKFARHANINTTDGIGNVTNNDCWTCHYQKDMNTSHVYLCDSCHKNSSGVVKVNDTALLIGILRHGSNTCKSCHAPDVYHSAGTAGPKGRVENPGWQLISSIDSAGCIDCHLNHNGLDAPFHGPGIDPNTTSGVPRNHMATPGGPENGSGCQGSCHNTNVHSLTQGNNNIKPTLKTPVLSPIIVANNEPVEVTTRGSAQDQFTSLQIEAAQYRIYNSIGQIIVDWTAMNAIDGRFNSSLETVNATISTTGLSKGTYNVSVRVMASGPKPSTLPEKLLPYYPLNGDWSNPLNATFTIKQERFINGTVINTTGSGIPGASVTVKNLISGVTYPAVTDNLGFYSLSLSNGTYGLIVSKDPEYYINNTIPSVDLESETIATRDIILTKRPVGTISGIVTNI